MVVLAALVATGCGSGASFSPTSPSGVSGATINGRVSGISTAATLASAGAMTMQATTSITVTVNGTNISTGVDGTGRFTLTNVPAGTVQLHFAGNGVDALITLTGVGERDQVEIDVSVNGREARVDRELRRNPEDGSTELEGTIAAIDASARTITVAATTILVPATADVHGGSGALRFADLKVGQRVEVHGTLNGSMLTASEVDLKDN
jgi:hypothetical protein